METKDPHKWLDTRQMCSDHKLEICEVCHVARCVSSMECVTHPTLNYIEEANKRVYTHILSHPQTQS